MTQYRTAEQFNDIIDSAVNGNWSQARDQVKKYGFYAEDLIKAYEELTAEYGEPPTYFKAADLAHLIPDSRTDRT